MSKNWSTPARTVNALTTLDPNRFRQERPLWTSWTGSEGCSYPGYFIRDRLEKFNLAYYFGQEATALFELMSEQIALALRHDCIRHDLPCVQCEELGQRATVNFMQDLPALRLMLASDVRAAYQGDPAAKSLMR